MTGTVQREMCSVSFDSLTLKLWIEQNGEFLKGARIQKIQQPTRRDFVLFVRNKGETKKLFININPQFYHVCFMDKTGEKKRMIQIPDKPPMFCMLLRKYLENAVISHVSQPEYERILEIYIETFNEVAQKIYLCLAVELMGKYSNVVLYNYDTNIILGCAHNVGSEKSRERELAGTLPYIYPPNPPVDWFASKNSFANSKTDDINKLIDDYYSEKIFEHKFSTLRANLEQIVLKRLKKYKNSYDKMTDKADSEKDCDNYRILGDLIMANLYNNNDYSNFIKVYDWSSGKDVEIALDETKTLKENANEFYKRYNKGKKSLTKIADLLEELQGNITYCEQVLYSIDIAQSISELLDIQDEICPQKEKSVKKQAIFPEELEIDGYRIFVGKNNRQNDYIVSKLSKDDDYWFHTKDCAGSHVLLKCPNPTDSLIFECAKLAKQYSKSSQSAKSAVIYTKRKNLKKPPKANLGYVIYKGEKEILV